MYQDIQKDKSMFLLSFVTAGVTVVAGIMHLQMVPMSISHSIRDGILFLVGGALQVFWVVPVIKQWGRMWQIIGIVGTAIFSAIWFATHIHNLLGVTGDHIPNNLPPSNMQQEGFHDNITGNHFPRGPPPTGIMSIPQVEYFQMAFIALYASMSKIISTKKKRDSNT